MKVPEKFYSIAQTCKILGVSRATLHRWRKLGLIDSTKAFGEQRVSRIFIPKVAVEALHNKFKEGSF